MSFFLIEKLKRLFTAGSETPAIHITYDAIEPLNEACKFALLVIDVEKQFCEGRERIQPTCDKIASIIPQFRKAAVQVYGVQYVDKWDSHGDDVKKDAFYKWTPEPSDILVEKWTNSAFDSGRTTYRLQQNNEKNLFVIGFNTGACVQSTAIDAVSCGYNVFVIEDLTDNNFWRDNGDKEKDLCEMRAAGVKVITSAQALKMVGYKP